MIIKNLSDYFFEYFFGKLLWGKNPRYLKNAKKMV